MADLHRLGLPPAPSRNPSEAFMLGLLDVMGELAAVLVGRGILTADELRVAMEKRAATVRSQHGDDGARPAQMLAEVAAIWAKPKALAFPKDAKVVQLRRPGTDDDGAAA